PSVGAREKGHTMRLLILVSLLAPLPARAAAAPSCAIPGPSPAQSVPVAAPVADATTSALPAGPPLAGPPLPASLASLAFSRHVSDAGAAVEDFGIAHGMHLMAARGGDEFMVFLRYFHHKAIALPLSPASWRHPADPSQTEARRWGGLCHGPRREATEDASLDAVAGMRRDHDLRTGAPG